MEFNDDNYTLRRGATPSGSEQFSPADDRQKTRPIRPRTEWATYFSLIDSPHPLSSAVAIDELFCRKSSPSWELCPSAAWPSARRHGGDLRTRRHYRPNERAKSSDLSHWQKLAQANAHEF